MNRRRKKGTRRRAAGRDGGREGSWHRLYSFTRSFIVRTAPRGSTKPLAHSELVTRPCGVCTCVYVCVSRACGCVRVTFERMYVLFRPFFPVRAYRPPSRRRRRLVIVVVIVKVFVRTRHDERKINIRTAGNGKVCFSYECRKCFGALSGRVLVFRNLGELL